jgi:hypothetical protein
VVVVAGCRKQDGQLAVYGFLVVTTHSSHGDSLGYRWVSGDRKVGSEQEDKSKEESRDAREHVCCVVERLQRSCDELSG